MSQLTDAIERASFGRGGVSLSSTGDRRSWGELRVGASEVALRLPRPDPGASIGLLADTSFQLIELIYASLIAGIPIAVLQPPARADTKESYLARLDRQIALANCSAVIVSPDYDDVGLDMTSTRVQRIASLGDCAQRPLPSSLSDDRVLVRHFSSGTTDGPSCVDLTHANVFAALRSTIAASNHARIHRRLLSWLPLSHDMGLFGFLFVAMLCGECDLIIDSPVRFLVNPRTWLTDIATYEATTIAAPNFAYALAAKTQARFPVRLGSLLCCLTGGERVTSQAVNDFLQAGEDFGLKSESLVVAYGLAEATLAVTMTKPGTGLHYQNTRLGGLERQVASCGEAVPGIELDIRPASSHSSLPEGEEGEIYVRGDAVSEQSVNDRGWLNTGDLGYLRSGQLFVVGRTKDVIIRGGRNYYPEDFEPRRHRKGCQARGCRGSWDRERSRNRRPYHLRGDE